MNGGTLCTMMSGITPSYEDTCSFTCDTGYELTGSDTRTCQSDGSWSGTDVMCTRGNTATVHTYILKNSVATYVCSYIPNGLVYKFKNKSCSNITHHAVINALANC